MQGGGVLRLRPGSTLGSRRQQAASWGHKGASSWQVDRSQRGRALGQASLGRGAMMKGGHGCLLS